MKYTIAILMAAFMVLGSMSVLGADVALVVKYPNGDIHTECVNVNDNTDGYATLNAATVPVTWSKPDPLGLLGHALCRINGIGDNPGSEKFCDWGAESWGFFIDNNGWTYSALGFDSAGGCGIGKYCATDGDMIGFVRTTYDNASNPLTFPSTADYDDICQRFIISDLDVKVDGEKDTNIQDEDDDYRIREDAKPESDIEFRIEVENLFEKRTVDIDDVEIVITIFDIDDGDDLEEESDEFDLKAGDTERETIEFTLPLFIEEGEYDVLIEIEGRGDNGKRYELTKELVLEVNKARHEVVVHRADLNPQVLACENTANLRVEVVNLGEDDEDEVRIVVTSQELDVAYERIDIELEADDEDDSVYSESFLIEKPEGLRNGNYQIRVDAYYDETKLEDSVIVPVTVASCDFDDEVMEVDEPDKTVVIVEPVQVDDGLTGLTGAVVTAPTTTYQAEEPETFWSSTIGIILLVMLNLLLLAGVIVLLTIALRRD